MNPQYHVSFKSDATCQPKKASELDPNSYAMRKEDYDDPDTYWLRGPNNPNSNVIICLNDPSIVIWEDNEDWEIQQFIPLQNGEITIRI